MGVGENQQMPRKTTHTSSYGVSRRESHDSSDFYSRKLYDSTPGEPTGDAALIEPALPEMDWEDRIYCQSSEVLPLADGSVALAFTSPPYNVGKEYEADLSMQDYLGLIRKVGREVYRVLKPGGRYVINVANLGRKPYIPLHALFYGVHAEIGFLPMGEIIWQKSKGASGSCAWGSWRSAKSPRLRDIHEYLLVFGKGSFTRLEKGISDLSSEEFMAATLSVWRIPSESAKRAGHPAPFPLELAERVIRLFSYRGDAVLDPFMGSGTTCVAAKKLARHYAGLDIDAGYCELAEKRLAEIDKEKP
jgi:modification methylase